jgi:uncharacterized protein
MKWKKTKNPDVIDQRGASGRGGGAGGGMIPIPSGGLGKAGGGVGIIGIIVFILLQFVVGGSGGGGGIQFPSSFNAPSDEQAPPEGADPQAELKDFSTYVFTDVQNFWEKKFQSEGLGRYQHAKLVLYSGGIDTGCGSATSAVGPFYCPADSRVYLDLSFYDDMKSQLGATGDFAWAYVIAHEMGHHIQNLEGTMGKKNGPEEGANGNSVRTELQADCYSGVWANSVLEQGDLESGDVEEAQNAAAAVGDDRLQKKSGGGINPDAFTHGTSEQRQHWFETGYDSGDAAQCDTFSVATP